MVICEDILSRTTKEITDLLIEYGCLGKRPFLTKEEERRLDDILDKAIEDEVLDFWIQEVDHILAHELNLIDDTWMSEQKDWTALLREYAGKTIPTVRPSVQAVSTENVDDKSNDNGIDKPSIPNSRPSVVA